MPRKKYSKPEIQEVELRPEEAALTACKSSSATAGIGQPSVPCRPLSPSPKPGQNICNRGAAS